MALLENCTTQTVSWSSVKLEFDMLANTTGNDITSDSNSGLQQLVDTVVESEIGEDLSTMTSDPPIADEQSVGALINSPAAVPSKELQRMNLSQSAVKWLDSADSRYKQMFQSKIQRLADGDRSYALSKRLKGCSYPVYEAKLDAGQRILWSQLQRGRSLSILVSIRCVWFVIFYVYDSFIRCGLSANTTMSVRMRSSSTSLPRASQSNHKWSKYQMKTLHSL
jgi:hypothetical protein